MPVIMLMEWAGVTSAQYDALRALVKLESNPPAGGRFHVAAFDAKGLRVTDIWDSADDFNRFVEGRLMPAVAQIGIEGGPKVEIYPVHATFTPS